MECKGSFSVEAAMLMPFVIIVVMTMVYYAIYIYDRTMLIADTNSIVVFLRDEKSVEVIERDERGIIFEILSQHPYLSLSNKEININSQEESVEIHGEWRLPVWKGLNRNLGYSQDIYKIDPICKMFTVDTIIRLMEDLENAN